MQALGLKKMNATSEHELTPQIEGYDKESVQHLVEVNRRLNKNEITYIKTS